MKVQIKRNVVEKFIEDNNLTKNKFSKNCYISVKTFDKFMRGERIALFIALKVASFMEIEYENLFDWKY